MDIQSRKISFIKEFLELQSEKTISLLEKVLKSETKNKVLEIEPMTIEQYQARIKISIQDSQNGNVTEADDLLSEIEKWG
ncbi:MAG: hypothetical protein EOP00_23145 [Pedobacter sp.]|nr:MAG: hypothetical protein EOP00_23145 [Pedobacter sp.]